eukprot:764515-Hanusia_phi.AAC.2
MVWISSQRLAGEERRDTTVEEREREDSGATCRGGGGNGTRDVRAMVPGVGDDCLTPGSVACPQCDVEQSFVEPDRSQADPQGSSCRNRRPFYRLLESFASSNSSRGGQTCRSSIE